MTIRRPKALAMYQFLLLCVLILTGRPALTQSGPPPQLPVGEQISYDLLQPVPQSELTELLGEDLAALGGEVLAGSPRAFIRFDHFAPPVAAGVFEGTGPSRIRITFPFTEHATVTSGAFIMTDETGASKLYLPGDSYFIRQGSIVVWTILTPRLQKSFLDVFEE